jgi:nuclear pore complex protein Nup188
LTSAAVSAFLRDGYVHQLLREPSKTFEPPTTQSRVDFETKTGAINVVPSPNDPYNLDNIKNDARWLSKNVNINEVAALRIVLVEYQARAHSHLTGPLSTQDVANIQEAAGVGDAQASAILALLNVTTVADAEATWADFESEASRRQRLLATYFSERQSFLGAADALITFLIYSQPSRALDPLCRAVGKEAFDFDESAVPPNKSGLEALAPTYIRLLIDCAKRTQTMPESLDKSILTDQLEIAWLRTALAEAIHAMSLVFQILDLNDSIFAPPEVVTQWFALMDAFEFFEPVAGGHALIAELIMPLRTLVAVISLKLLNIDRALLYLDQDVDLLDNEEPYLASSDALTQIHTTVAAAASAGLMTALPVVFAWSLIVHQMHLGYQERAERRDLLQNQRAQAGFELEYEPSERQRRNSAGSIVSIETSSYDVFLVSQQLERNIEPAETMAKVATSRGQVYELMREMASCLGSGQMAAFRGVLGARARLVFQDLLKRSAHYVGYQEEPVDCLLSILSGGSQYWDISLDVPSDTPSLALYRRMLKDDTLDTQFTSQSQFRFPYEFLPFSSLWRILSGALIMDEENSERITSLLLKTPSLTLDWDHRWRESYELVFEEENTNSFQLTRDIHLFESTAKSNRRFSPEEMCTIPSGTFGRFLTDSSKVAKLDFEHSAIALLGKRLEVNLTADAYDSGLGRLTMDELVEGIGLLATILRVETLKSSKTDSDRGMSILNEASRLLPRGKDIISIICDTIDNLVEEESADLDGVGFVALTSCLQFLHAALPVFPGRVWAYMARCALINSDTRSGRLSRITANLDMIAERFDLLLSAVRLFSSLVDGAMTSAVRRRTAVNGNSPNSRSKGEENPWVGASDKIISRVSLSIAQTTLDVFENSATWRFPSELDRSILVRDVVVIMHRLISYTHGVGSNDTPQSLTKPLAPAAGYIVESFLSSSSSSLRFQPLLATLLVAFQIPDSTLYARRARIVAGRLTAVLAFATTLLRVADYLDQASAVIQTQLFKSASVIARLPAIRHSFKMPAISLLSALVESAGKGSGVPPSLLGYLGPQISRSFIQIASQLDKPFDRIPEVVSTWKFFSTILRNRQQWMANCLLTGKTPREALKADAKISQLSAGSVLSTALEKLGSISKISSQETLAILDFFTSAQNYWPWTIIAMQKDRSFLQHLRSYVRELKAPSVVSKADPAEACYQARVAAYIAETFAMQLYHLRQMRQEQTFASELVNDLDYFLRDGVHVSDYNSSLHANFARNFAKRYSGCSTDDFKRTLLVPRDLGSQYYYALDVAEAMLNYDAGWAGSRQNGFRREMETANLNLSLVEAEVVSG